MDKKTVLVFTGGGLAPALNPTLAGVITTAQRHGMRVLGGLYGWACLGAHGKVIDLTTFDAAPLRHVGGTFLRSSRTNPFAVDDGITILQEKIKEYGVDYIIAIGGDDTLGAASRLFREYNIPVIGIPKTIDNDLQGTYWSPGYPSAAHYTAQYAYEIKVDAAYALSRVFVIEVLGRQSGWLTAAAAYGLADIILPPEREYKLDAVLQAVQQRYEKNGNYVTVVLSEEARFDREVQGMLQDANKADSYQVQRKAFVAMGLCKKITEELGISGKPLFPGNFMQTGNPIDIDAQIALQLGEHAVDLALNGSLGQMACVRRSDLGGSRIDVSDIPLAEAVGKVRFIDDSYFDFDQFQVTDAFIKYAEPFLGPLAQRQTDPYLHLITDISHQ
ncbi:MAG: 6-phosphofructokinase [Candidatus Kerfeldbacteria bacterium]|nr:6-phosphofructokinase [Candidatus Kerfeldbacteria bacterium]